MTSQGPYRTPGATTDTPIPLVLDGISNRFKTYLMAVEMLVLELPSVIQELEAELGGETAPIRRLSDALERINKAGKI